MGNGFENFPLSFYGSADISAKQLIVASPHEVVSSIYPLLELTLNCQALVPNPLVPNPQSRGLGLTLKSFQNANKQGIQIQNNYDKLH